MVSCTELVEHLGHLARSWESQGGVEYAKCAEQLQAWLVSWEKVERLFDAGSPESRERSDSELTENQRAHRDATDGGWN